MYKMKLKIDGITTIICDDVLNQSLLCKYINDTGCKVLDIKVLPYQKKLFLMVNIISRPKLIPKLSSNISDI